MRYGPVIAEQIREEAAARGRAHGLDFAEIHRRVATDEAMLT
jgi:hypothetical protein